MNPDYVFNSKVAELTVALEKFGIQIGKDWSK